MEEGSENGSAVQVPADGAVETSIEATREVDVFISYRLDPDEARAIALKRLLESAISPRLNVFVSSEGGLRPSNIALKPQLLAALKAAKVVVAIITPASSSREWVLYEAGAAWGREQVYTPLLIGIPHEAVASVMADFVSVNARDQDAVRTLLDVICKKCGCKVMERFGTRYAAFERALKTASQKDALKGGSTDLGETSGASEIDPEKAADLAWASGDKDEAERQWQRALDEGGDPAYVRVRRIVTIAESDPETFDRLIAKESTDVNGGVYAAMWRALLARFEHERVERYREVISRSDVAPLPRMNGTIWLAQALSAIDRRSEATELLLAALRDTIALKLRAMAAVALCKARSDLSPLARLLILASACDPRSEELGELASDLSVEQGWKALSLVFTQRVERLQESSGAKNNLGRAYQAAGFHSLAYLAYRAASTKGASVAKVNAANLVANHPVHAAGLEMMEHDDTFDAGDKSFPFTVRAMLERALQNERAAMREAYNRGATLLELLVELASKAFASKQAPNVGSRFYMPSDSPNDRVTCERLEPFGNLFELKGKTGTALAVFGADGPTMAISFKLDELNVTPRRIALTPAEEPVSPKLVLPSSADS